MNNLKINFEFEKETKNTIRFKEVLNGPLDVPNIGTLYVPKQTLKQIGYKEGNKLIVELKSE
jgi:hypothetical protein